jgi:hypothetical protein
MMSKGGRAIIFYFIKKTAPKLLGDVSAKHIIVPFAVFDSESLV